MSEFEEWFKTTSAYRMLESMNYYKMDLFHWIEARGEYRHTSVQIAFMTWVEQQAKIDELQARIDIYEKHVKAIKHIHETQFNEESESSYILGNLDGFFECVESESKGKEE